MSLFRTRRWLSPSLLTHSSCPTATHFFKPHAIKRPRLSTFLIVFRCLCVLAIFLSSEHTVAQSKNTKYVYDALGRLTFVEDSQNGNRDYDYDPAGNRTEVAVGNDGEIAVPATPTGFRARLVNSRYSIYEMQWDSVPHSTYYLLTIASSPRREVKVTATSQATVSYVQHQYRGLSVKACNSVGCSEPGY